METLEQEVLRLREENADLRRKLERIGIYARAYVATEESMRYIYQGASDTMLEDIQEMIEAGFKKDINMVLSSTPPFTQ